MDLNLSGKTALITGGSKGLGLAIAQRFASEGCHLHLAARSQTTLEKAAEAYARMMSGKAEFRVVLTM